MGSLGIERMFGPGIAHRINEQDLATWQAYEAERKAPKGASELPQQAESGTDPDVPAPVQDDPS